MTQVSDSDLPRWLTTLASLTVGLVFFGCWLWLLPGWLGFQPVGREGGWRWLAALPAAAGFGVALRCVWDFGWRGRGTPAPLAPPRRLVVSGLYRFVRNPMYIGFGAGWVGLWIVFGRVTAAAVVVPLVAGTAATLFVLFYEEPTLRRMFGAEYEAYSRHVPRWWPRLKPWDGRD